MTDKLSDEELRAIDLPWKCAGCGTEAMGRIKPCGCPTNCGFRGRGHEMEHTTFTNSSADFARWIEQGPALALAAGLYVGIKVYASEAEARKMGDIS